MSLPHADARILLVEDNHLIRQMLRDVLAEAGYKRIDEAPDGDCGLKKAAQTQPQLVCLDMFLPDTDGVDVLAELKRCAPETQVLVLTARRDRETVEACVKGGAAAYIIKPFEADTILKTVERLLDAKTASA